MKFPAPSNLFKAAARHPAWLSCAILFFSLNGPALATEPGQQEVTRDFTKTMTLSGNQGLSLDHRLGQVHIHGDSGHELKISAKIHVQDRNNADAQDFAQKSRSKFANPAMACTSALSIREQIADRPHRRPHFLFRGLRHSHASRRAALVAQRFRQRGCFRVRLVTGLKTATEF